MKYNFNLEDDIVSLKYKDKEFSFKVNVKLISEMQGIVMEAPFFVQFLFSFFVFTAFSQGRRRNGKFILEYFTKMTVARKSEIFRYYFGRLVRPNEVIICAE